MVIYTQRPRHRQIHVSTTQFARTIRALIQVGAAFFATAFVWIQFKDFPIDTFVISDTTPLLLWHGALSLYYISWIVGATFDVDVQELVYTGFPKGGRIPSHGIITIFALISAGILLGWTAGDIRRFCIALDIFIIVDHIAWRYLKWLLTPIIRTSDSTYREARDYFALEELRVVQYQILGDWKWWRFIGTLPIIVLLHAFAFSGIIQSNVTMIIVSLVTPLPSADVNAFISGLLVLQFVLVSEIWSWAHRIRTLMYIKCIDELYARYLLTPVSDKKDD